MTNQKKKKPAGAQYVIARDDAYWKDDKPVKKGTKVTLTKTEAAKLAHRGIIEEK